MDWQPKLIRKGWSQQEAQRAVRILERAQQEKTPALRIVDAVVYWFGLFLGVLGNFSISIVLVPFLLVMTDEVLVISLLLLGLAFGALLDMLLKEIEHLQTQHFIVPELFIPAIAAINMYLVTTLANRLAGLMKLPTLHNPWTVSIIYVAAFLLPHAYRKWRTARRRQEIPVIPRKSAA